MHHIVYCTTNLINGKQYVGIHSTRDINDGYLGSGIMFKQAVDKYGEENFDRKILFECNTRIEALWLESLIISEWVIKKWGYGRFFYNKLYGGLTQHREKVPVKSMSISGRVCHYKSITETSFNHGCISTGIKYQRVRYNRLWKLEKDDSPWVWPEWFIKKNEIWFKISGQI